MNDRWWRDQMTRINRALWTLCVLGGVQLSFEIAVILWLGQHR